MQTQNSIHYIQTSTDTAAKLPGLKPWFSRIIMGPPVLIFTLIGLRHITDPAHAVPGTVLTTPEAFTDTRVMGAWTLTLMLMQVVSLLSSKRLWLGHLQLVVFMGLTLAVRIFGFLHDGTFAMGNQRMITVVEIVFLVLNSVGLVLQTRQSRQL